MPDVESPPVSRDGNKEDEPMSSELAGEGENIFRAVGDIILAISVLMTSMSDKTNERLAKYKSKQHHSGGRHV